AGAEVAAVPDRQLVRDRLRHRPTVRPGEQATLGETVEVAARGGGGCSEAIDQLIDRHLALRGEQVEDGGEAGGAIHATQTSAGSRANRRSIRAASSATASRPGATYLRESTRFSSAASFSRTARVKKPFRCVDTLILVMPARTACTITSSETPDEPCSTSGTSPPEWPAPRSAARNRPISSMSRDAERSSIACEDPTATAR